MKVRLTATDRQTQNLQVELAAAQARLETQQSMATELRTHLEQVRLGQLAVSDRA